MRIRWEEIEGIERRARVGKVPDVFETELLVEAAKDLLGRTGRSGEWIAVEERLPGEGVAVVIACESPGAERVWIGYRESGAWWTAENDAVCVSHWLELPEPPVNGRKARM